MTFVGNKLHKVRDNQMKVLLYLTWRARYYVRWRWRYAFIVFMTDWRHGFGLIVGRGRCWWNICHLISVSLIDISIHYQWLFPTGILIDFFLNTFQLGSVLTLSDHKVNKVFNKMQTLNWQFYFLLMDKINGQIDQLELKMLTIFQLIFEDLLQDS